MNNLLPPQERKLILTDYRRRRLAVGVFLLTVIVLVVTGLFGLQAGRFKSAAKNTRWLREIEEKQQGHQTFIKAKDSISQVNRHITVLSALTKPDVGPAGFINKVLLRRPVGVVISGFNYRSNFATARTITLIGRAETRASLLFFIDALKKEPAFAAVDSPVANLIREKDADFTVTINLAPDR